MRIQAKYVLCFFLSFHSQLSNFAVFFLDALSHLWKGKVIENSIWKVLSVSFPRKKITLWHALKGQNLTESHKLSSSFSLSKVKKHDTKSYCKEPLNLLCCHVNRNSYSIPTTSTVRMSSFGIRKSAPLKLVIQTVLLTKYPSLPKTVPMLPLCWQWDECAVCCCPSHRLPCKSLGKRFCLVFFYPFCFRFGLWISSSVCSSMWVFSRQIFWDDPPQDTFLVGLVFNLAGHLENSFRKFVHIYQSFKYFLLFCSQVLLMQS